MIILVPIIMFLGGQLQGVEEQVEQELGFSEGIALLRAGKAGAP